MEIIVCVKQVPDAKDVRLDPVTNTLAREGVESILNPYDQHALEAAVTLKEQFGGQVTVISMGPPQAEEVLRLAISCGADRAFLISDRQFAGADTWATAYTLAKAIEKIGHFDLIVCGKQAIDGDTAQVGPGLAVRLGIGYATCIQHIREANGEHLVVERMMDSGYDVLRAHYPFLMTVVKDINQPRVPSLKGKMRAKKAVITTLNAQDIDADPASIGLPGSPTQVVRVFAPQPRGKRAMLSGTVDEQAAALVASIKPYLL
ncbi:MAG: electron transfer flavoprotein subunit beta/FixA family protein [Desulfofustis sp. PB-SRB1]|jgi:electron transfer flavoprotein beta subunit|nr:electron transfer flavoprotein subunit beta/FixA family protein [Desulfofustis sp. PB-SRB1]MBM1003883.1 electron transfer flavoprotein subunit beta/FixA family protein [Desulfofustis sp. PB-SRB1]HBH29143.1 electron transfer flavoprotein subunit beta/FixA family protein [Desulfofustis sp.]